MLTCYVTFDACTEKTDWQMEKKKKKTKPLSSAGKENTLLSKWFGAANPWS